MRSYDAWSCEVPWPPTVNTYWRHVGHRTLISERGRKYRQDLGLIIRGPRLKSRLRVQLDCYPGDMRKRDLDNLPKSLLDALTYAGVWIDDEQIDDLRIRRMQVEKPGFVRVSVWEI